MEETAVQETVEETIAFVRSMDTMRIATCVGALIALLIISRIIVRVMAKLLDKFPGIPPTLHTILLTMLRFVLDFVSIMVVANMAGIPITSFVAVFSVAGLAISLSVQGILNNLVGGIIILMSKPFALGDFIESDAVSGTVEDLAILHTRLKTPDGKVVFVPNNLLYTARVINYTMSGRRRVELSISAGYEAAPARVRAAIMQAVRETENILTDPAPAVMLESYDDSAIRYTIHVWTEAASFLGVKYALNEKLYETFALHGVPMTYPHLNVHMMDKH